MHRATLAASATTLPSSQFRENALNRDSHQMSPAVNSISRDDVVLLSHRSLHADSDRFLPGVEMTETSNDFLLVEITSRRFETSDCLHVPIHLESFIARHFDSVRWCIIEIVCLEWLRTIRRGRHEKTINLFRLDHQFTSNKNGKLISVKVAVRRREIGYCTSRTSFGYFIILNRASIKAFDLKLLRSIEL